MNNKIILSLVLLFAIITLMCSCDNYTYVDIIQRSSNQEMRTIQYYNGKSYYYLYDYHMHFSNQKTIPNEAELFYFYYLPPENRIDIEVCISQLPPLSQTEKYSIQSNQFYIYQGDDVKNPILIFEKNNTPLGVSDGWFYVAEDYDFVFPEIQLQTPVAFVIYDTSWNIIDTVTNSDTIQRLLQDISQKKEIIDYLPVSNAIEYRIYAKFDSSPFMQSIALNNDSGFQYIPSYSENLKTGDGSPS